MPTSSRSCATVASSIVSTPWRYARLDLCTLAVDDPQERDRLSVLSQLTDRRTLAGMVEVLRPAAGSLRDGLDNAATLEWRNLWRR